MNATQPIFGIESLEDRSVPTTGLINGLVGGLEAVGAAASLNGQVSANVAGTTANVGIGLNTPVTNGTVGAKATVNASTNITLPNVNNVLSTATGLVDQVLADVNSLLPSGVSV